jgi:hypothetical protein
MFDYVQKNKFQKLFTERRKFDYKKFTKYVYVITKEKDITII